MKKELNLPKIKTKSIAPETKFTLGNRVLDFSITDFWTWNQSDLIENRNRGILAEYLVKKALKIDTNTTRLEWDSYDFITNNGIKIEVKSASYIQAWAQKKYSTISFDIAPKKTLIENTYSKEKARHADVYIFCLLDEKDQEKINPMDLEQWTFYLCLTKYLNDYNPIQKSISISTIKTLPHKKCSYIELNSKFHSLNINQE